MITWKWVAKFVWELKTAICPLALWSAVTNSLKVHKFSLLNELSCLDPLYFATYSTPLWFDAVMNTYLFLSHWYCHKESQIFFCFRTTQWYIMVKSVSTGALIKIYPDTNSVWDNLKRNLSKTKWRPLCDRMQECLKEKQYPVNKLWDSNNTNSRDGPHHSNPRCRGWDLIKTFTLSTSISAHILNKTSKLALTANLKLPHKVL